MFFDSTKYEIRRDFLCLKLCAASSDVAVAYLSLCICFCLVGSLALAAWVCVRCGKAYEKRRYYLKYNTIRIKKNKRTNRETHSQRWTVQQHDGDDDDNDVGGRPVCESTRTAKKTHISYWEKKEQIEPVERKQGNKLHTKWKFNSIETSTNIQTCQQQHYWVNTSYWRDV